MKDLRDRSFIEKYNFNTGGLMPLALRFYHVISEYVRPYGFSVSFPRWTRGPLGLAMQLRGTENILIDLIESPEETEKLFQDLVDLHKSFYSDREKVLGIPVQPLVAINDDEVNCPTISPEIYSEMVLPFERRITDFHGGLQYFHSCGDITKMLESAKTLEPGLVLISPVTDMKRAAEVFSGTPLEVSVHPVRDVQIADDEQMLAAVKERVEICADKQVKAFHITQGGLQPLRDREIDKELERVKSWVRILRNFQQTHSLVSGKA